MQYIKYLDCQLNRESSDSESGHSNRAIPGSLYPKNLLRQFFENNLARQETTSKKKTLAWVNVILVLKAFLLRVFTSITSEIKICFEAKTGWPRFGSVRLRFGDGTVQAVLVFGSGGSSKEGVLVFFSTASQRGRFRFRFWFLENGSGGSGSDFGFGKNGSDGSGSGSVPEPPWKFFAPVSEKRLVRFSGSREPPQIRFRFGSWATLQKKRASKDS